jgi:hypothetical protein
MNKIRTILLPGLLKLRTAITKTPILSKDAFTAIQQKYTKPEKL